MGAFSALLSQVHITGMSNPITSKVSDSQQGPPGTQGLAPSHFTPMSGYAVLQLATTSTLRVVRQNRCYRNDMNADLLRQQSPHPPMPAFEAVITVYPPMVSVGSSCESGKHQC